MTIFGTPPPYPPGSFDDPRRFERPPRPRSNWLGLLAIWALIFIVVWSWWRKEHPRALLNPAAEPRAIIARGDLAQDEKANIEVFKEASPSVVYITTREVARDYFSLNLFEIPRGTGSGFIFDRDGHIVTNYHVVAEGRRWLVKLADQTEHEAVLIGTSRDKDLAVLRIDAEPAQIKPIAIGSSSDLIVGQKVFAIGNPFGFDQTLTTGIVSALGREIQSLSGRAIHDVIQTDAAINPGNSGGPLLDSAGRLIGVNTQIASPSGTSAGIGFAIPVDTVNRVATDLIRHGQERRPMLGINVWPDNILQRSNVKGVLIREAPNGSAAQKAGLRGTVMDRGGQIRQLGDLIVKINDYPVNDQNSLLDVLERFNIGDEVTIAYIRDNERKTTRAKLQPPTD